MAQVWKEYNAPDGRKYWSDGQTSVWNKPDALMSPAERALSQSPWKEYTTPDGRKYWHNSQDKQTTWEIPQVYKDVLVQQPPARPAQQPPPSFVAGGSSAFSQGPQQSPRNFQSPADRPGGRPPSDNFRSHFVPAAPTSNEPEFRNQEEAEDAFMKLLKKYNVQRDWPWERAMKAILRDPQYRSIKDPKDRRAAFDKYVIESKIQDKEREKERMAKLGEDFTKMLKSHPEITHCTRWKTARPIIEGETIFRSTDDDAERRQLYEDYIIGMKKAFVENQSSEHKSALEELASIFKSLHLEPYTRWTEAQGMLEGHERFKGDDKFKTLTKSDVLATFDHHIKSLERSFNETRQHDRFNKFRRERQNRDQFAKLLQELKMGGKIRAGTKWMDIQPLIEDDPRYVAMLGQKGSTPLDLFWDTLEDEERSLRQKRYEILDVLDDFRFEIKAKTSFDEFISVMQRDRRSNAYDEVDLRLIFDRLIEKVVRRDQEMKHQQDKLERRAVDDLRSRIKHLKPAINSTTSWEDVRPRVENSKEYRDLPSDETRRTAFDKVILRLKEKEADAEQLERSRRERRDAQRNGTSGRRHSPSQRSPEPDAYEADRRKAQADRERQYRKTSVTGLSPPPFEAPRRRDHRERDYWERDERYDSRRSGRLSRDYDREYRDPDFPTRRISDIDRPRGYMSRADPRDGPSRELDYGESGPVGSMNGSASGSERKRRVSGTEETDGGGRRDSKRMKRASKTPNETTPVEEEENLKSGSEEGEIEEE